MVRIVGSVVVAITLLASTAQAGRGGGSHTSRSSSSGMRGMGSSSSSHTVRGYTKKNGTYVAPHRQTNADHTQLNNYSTKGNVNPSTGKTGSHYAAH
jgi:hypothetical protein